MVFLKPVLFLTGIILILLSLLMCATATICSLFGKPVDWQAFLFAALYTYLPATFLVLRNKQTIERLHPNQLFLITVSSWLLVSVFASLPFMLSRQGLSLTDAVFETVSGLTTTGSTIMTGLDTAPAGLLLWRSLLQWLGGIGIIGVAVAILPFLRVGGMRLFQTESSDWSEKAIPQVRKLAKFLVSIYVALSLLCGLAYYTAGMSGFDALNHAMTTVSTGGYSTHDASLAYFASPTIEWVSLVFMLTGALPFSIYARFAATWQWRVFKDAQIKGFFALLILVISVLVVYLVLNAGFPFEQALRLAAFNVVSVVTTTGFATHDYTLWGPLAIAVFFFLTFVGGCSGSTSGGMKIFRFQLSWLLLRGQIWRLVHPRGLFNRRYNGRYVEEEILISAVAFSFAYFVSFGAMALILAGLGLDLVTALSGAATALGNVGPGLGSMIGPAGNFQALPDVAKWVLAVGMLLGRLEILSVFVVFSAYFWRG